MNSRLEFNEKLLILLSEMTEAGEHWLIDYVKRSDEEQRRLFMLGRDERQIVRVFPFSCKSFTINQVSTL